MCVKMNRKEILCVCACMCVCMYLPSFYSCGLWEESNTHDLSLNLSVCVCVCSYGNFDNIIR